MTAPVRPASAKNYGNDKWSFVPTIAAIATPLLTEVNAAGALDISCYLFDSWTLPSIATNTVAKPKRVCDTAVYDQIGDTTYNGGEIRYAVNPQAAAASAQKVAFEKFPSGTTGYLVRRMALPYAGDFATGQFVDVYPVEFGPQLTTEEGDGESAEAGILQTYTVTGPPAIIKALT